MQSLIIGLTSFTLFAISQSHLFVALAERLHHALN